MPQRKGREVTTGWGGEGQDARKLFMEEETQPGRRVSRLQVAGPERGGCIDRAHEGSEVGDMRANSLIFLTALTV